MDDIELAQFKSPIKNLMRSAYIIYTYAIYILLLTNSCVRFYLSIDNMMRAVYILPLTIPFVQFIPHFL